ncbi:putative alpha/beta hydrolase [Rhizobium sp. ERR 1071]|uniref:alpha/beta hydrolase family protein n=1 Tax=Rhizobium sp. ERR 1071 TaxID=2572677 RepID=UPI001199F49D|nr:alpha/beta fold hydrolase [Rhizobium sp. ERR1071]TWB09550.1 putative alpha/beta hydrolase [Rhizobium sp. ERR1071]
MFHSQSVEIVCADQTPLAGDLWLSRSSALGRIIINPATGVAARYYHQYAAFLAGHGFDVLTYDYRGIGRSRPASLRGCKYRWRDWGERDFQAALRFMHERGDSNPISVVGHSIGGFLLGLATSVPLIDRALTVGAQYAWWGDYARKRRLALFWKWHVVMPIVTSACGYFPGKRLGWLEDLPAGVAYEWSFRRPRFERSHPPGDRRDVLRRGASVEAEILALTVSDDDLGTPQAIRRALDYFTGSRRATVILEPRDYGRTAIGHFGLFHDSHASGFWLDTLLWLRDGINPWPNRLAG